MNAPVRPRERRTVPLNLITGRSPFNCRPEGTDDEVAALAASIRGLDLIHPLLVSRVPGPLLKFWVDDGGRRFAALGKLCEDGAIPADHPVDCDVLIAEEGTSREISLAANLMRRDLHPVDQCAAFAALIESGLTVDKIAADFAITTRQVNQRLRLQKLSPAVRTAWRDGTLTTEAAQAMTVARSHEAQDALLAAGRESHWLLRNPHTIRERLLGTATRGDTPEALYLGAGAYVAGGGAIDENLFEDTPIFLDAELLQRLAREKMMRDGERILADTGFSFCMIADDVEGAWNWPRVAGDFLADEKTRLREIEVAEDPEDEPHDGPVSQRRWQDRQDGEDHDQWNRRLEEEDAAINARAIQRACTPQLRAKAGIFLDLSGDGTLKVEYGILRPKEKRAAIATLRDEPPAPSNLKTAPAPEKPADPIEAAGSGRGQVRGVLETTIQTAIVQVVGDRPDLALLFMVARYAGTYRPDYLVPDFGLEPTGKASHATIGKLESKDFNEAVGICASLPLADLTSSFARIVAGSIKLTHFALLTALDPLMGALARRGAPLRAAFVAAMDYDAYFGAATKQGCLAALDAIGTEHVDRQAKKPVLAAIAADAARTATWLPFPLAGWAEVKADKADANMLWCPTDIAAIAPIAEDPSTTLANAMDEAIHDDVERQSTFEAWMSLNTVRHAQVKIKVGTLYEAYRADVGKDLALSIQAFGLAIAAMGILKRRSADGWRYLGLSYLSAEAAA